MKKALAAWSIPIVIAVLALAALLAGDHALALRYERGAVLEGQVHRLLTGHFPHLGSLHLAINLAGLGLVWWLVGANARPREWLCCCLVAMLAVCGGLLAFEPELAWYVGLSGLLHGLLVAGAMLGRRGDLLIVPLVAGKLAWEWMAGPASSESLGGATIIEAHFYGAIGGVLAGLLILAIRMRTPGRNQADACRP